MDFSTIKRLLSMHEALDSISSLAKTVKEKVIKAFL